MRVLQTYQLTILTTDGCTAKCAHCCMNSSPERATSLSAAQMCRYIDEAKDSAGIQLVIFAGGEPLLLGEELFATLSHVRQRGLMSRVVTNGYWAATPARAAATAARLRSSGLNELNISIDDFHLPYVKPEWVKNAFVASRALDFDAIIIAHCAGESTRFNAPELDALLGERLPRVYDESGGRSAIAPNGTKPFIAVSNTTVLEVGRGIDLGLEDAGLDAEWQSRARRLGGCPWAVRSPAIAPSGHLVACCGFEVAGNPILDIGDLESSSMSELLDRADGDMLLNMIALDGPFRIMDYLKAADPTLPFRDNYRTFCELCQDIVTKPEMQRALVRAMPHRAQAILAYREALVPPAPQTAHELSEVVA